MKPETLNAVAILSVMLGTGFSIYVIYGISTMITYLKKIYTLQKLEFDINYKQKDKMEE